MEGGRPADRATLARAREALSAGGFSWRRVLPFLGPAFVAAVAYVDPGNFATNIQGGSAFGYTLLWVVLAANLAAMLVQALSAKLGIATGKNLAEVTRDHVPGALSWILWVLMEGVAIATDLAEFLGGALGFHLLLGVPLALGGVLTLAVMLGILALERFGFRPLEAVISGLAGVIALAYVVEVVLGEPDWGSLLYHAFVPTFRGTESVLLATGILGATVMPHAIFVHSALTQGRIVVKEEDQKRRLFRFEVVDVVLAMSLAGLVNAAMLAVAAATFHRAGLTEVASLEEAHQTLAPLLGGAASFTFALALLASGLSSSAVGTMAGQVIMQGFVRKRIPVWVRRLVTSGPAFLVIALGLDPTRTLVVSQVVLSFGLPFALVPLVVFTSKRDVMGTLVNRLPTTLAASFVTVLVIFLDLYLLARVLGGG